MAYVTLGRTEDIYRGYKPRKGLEGPFVFAGGRVLYYDPVEGSYYDPTTDFYVDSTEMSMLHNELMRMLDKSR
jgi:OCRE domain